MFELLQSGGWLMLPIITCSVLATTITVERFWTLQQQKICPSTLIDQIYDWVEHDKLNSQQIEHIQHHSPLGQILAAGLVNRHHGRAVMKESIEDVGRHVVLDLGKYLNALGTIASITPLLGLLGTVIGMIKVFSAISLQNMANAAPLASGISEALVTTAAGMAVAIPSLMFYRYFQGNVSRLVSMMEQESLKLVETIAGEREKTS